MNEELFDLETPDVDVATGRDRLDRYYTPPWATQALVDYLGGRLKGGVWDPCCGKDWGGRVIREAAGVNRFLGTDNRTRAVHWLKAWKHASERVVCLGQERARRHEN